MQKGGVEQMGKFKGIDVSEHQPKINYSAVAPQIDFVILREGRREYIDVHFLEHVNGFKKVGVPIIGIYHFIYATTVDGAIAEAVSCVKNVEKAGLPKSTMIWADMEYDTVDKALSNDGIIYTPTMANANTIAFCEKIKEYGYTVGIYSNNDWIKNWYYKKTISSYPLWLADYSGEPDHDCLMQQYTSKGVVNGISGTVDMDYYYGDIKKTDEPKNTDSTKDEKTVTAQDALNVFRSWIGRNEYDNTHRYIIDLYNSYKPLARGYAVQYNDQWCDTTISALFIYLNAVDLIGGTECGVEEHVKLFKKAGIWIEDGTITPEPGDIIVFNWGQNSQPNDGYSDHIGMVESVSGKNITTIEGNYKDSVGRRIISIGHGNIRGYARPKYGTTASNATSSSQTGNTNTSAISIPTSVVRYGSTGADVKTLQKWLNNVGYSLSVDGDFGSRTRSAVVNFQRKYSLEIDGIVGKNTWTKLASLQKNGEQVNTPNTPSREPKWTGQVTASLLNVRVGAGSDYARVAAYPQLGYGNLVDVCDEVKSASGDTWYYIRIAGSVYGYVHSNYIRAVN